MIRYNCKINVILKGTTRTLDINCAFETPTRQSEKEQLEIMDGIVYKTFLDRNIAWSKFKDYVAVAEEVGAENGTV